VRDTKSFKTYMALLITVAVISVLLILCYNPVPVTSNDAANATVSGAAVAYQAPTFI
jgi:competence protein ComGC